MISLDDAMVRVLSMAKRLPAQQTPLEEAAGHYLAGPVLARTSQPRFDGSAMDGYAVRHMDAQAGATLQLIGTAAAGAAFDGMLTQGQCVRIFTGAPVPKGADAVIMQENVQADGDQITIVKGVNDGQHIRTAGRDFAEGQQLLDIGDLMTPAAIMLAAASNNDYVSVAPKPVVTLLATGDELVPVGSDLGPSRIVSSNSPGLAALFAPFADSVDDLGIAPDNEDELRAMLKLALDSEADVIVTTGGASVGDHDLVQPMLKSLGVEMDFWKISMRPGKPLMFGTYGKTMVFGLPGNPVSAMVTALMVVVPALRALAGCTEPRGNPVMMPLTKTVAANGERQHFLRCHVALSDDGTMVVEPFQETDSSHLTSLAGANGLIAQEANAPARKAGDLVPVILMPWTHISQIN